MKNLMAVSLVTLAACGSTQSVSEKSVDADANNLQSAASVTSYVGKYDVVLTSKDKGCDELHQTWDVQSGTTPQGAVYYIINTNPSVEWWQSTQGAENRGRLEFTEAIAYDYNVCQVNKTRSFSLTQNSLDWLAGNAVQPYQSTQKCRDAGAYNIADIPACTYSVLAVKK